CQAAVHAYIIKRPLLARVLFAPCLKKVQHFSMSDSSFSGSDEFFTPNPEMDSFCSETSTNADFTANQFTKESTGFEEELEITREIYQKNTGSLRNSSSSDTDGVEGKRVSQKVTVQRSSDRDRSRVSKHSLTPSSGSFSDILDLSCIPCDGDHNLLLSKTPLSTCAPIDNSTPFSVSTGEKVNQMPEEITSEEIVQEFMEDERGEKIVPERQQEENQGLLEHPSDWEKSSMQKSMAETERAHSTLDSVLEEMSESQEQPKEKITKMWTNRNNALSGEALR
ncbi:uncharacterized protein, partial [Heterodontus francisci]|uniref:uncharacterized protein n=1 Tax=Heterodontus francisci TaxID=7792 RepID=UPI00355BE54B